MRQTGGWAGLVLGVDHEGVARALVVENFAAFFQHRFFRFFHIERQNGAELFPRVGEFVSHLRLPCNQHAGAGRHILEPGKLGNVLGGLADNGGIHGAVRPQDELGERFCLTF